MIASYIVSAALLVATLFGGTSVETPAPIMTPESAITDTTDGAHGAAE